MAAGSAGRAHILQIHLACAFTRLMYSVASAAYFLVAPRFIGGLGPFVGAQPAMCCLGQDSARAHAAASHDTFGQPAGLWNGISSLSDIRGGGKSLTVAAEPNISIMAGHATNPEIGFGSGHALGGARGGQGPSRRVGGTSLAMVMTFRLVPCIT